MTAARRIVRPARKIRTPARKFVPAVPTCIECGCTDLDGCEEGCWWIRQEGVYGVCSSCPPKQFDAGERTVRSA